MNAATPMTIIVDRTTFRRKRRSGADDCRRPTPLGQPFRHDRGSSVPAPLHGRSSPAADRIARALVAGPVGLLVSRP
ncbi:hypothetical protein CP557_04260 [Natrinema ejinorense]|uniref:Uncharacterized protein n=1 Tax=Natrinema ejinorense TaxID=373386 RepID=A0A2A5QSK8_9EURY|nr:hypothetical protein CP557_04260 [Natrinema ejinorense]